MSGKLLVVEGEDMHRARLDVRLRGAFYDVLQAQTLSEAQRLVTHADPDMILIGSKLTDEGPLRFCRNLRNSPTTAHLPVLLLTDEDDRKYRVKALKSGADDVLVRPITTKVLLPRLRSLMRRNEYQTETLMSVDTAQALGLAEAQSEFHTRASVLLATRDTSTAESWQRILSAKAPYHFSTRLLDDALRSVTQSPAPDVFVIMPDAADPDVSLRLIAEIRARSITRHSAVLVVLTAATRDLHGDALDLGAQDVMNDGFDRDEMSLRISKLIQHKRLSDRLRDNVKHGLQAAVTDSLTGLFNRRYAVTQLAKIAEQSAVKDHPYAVMMADLDRFKEVNDRYGHSSGDSVLIETAKRLREALRPMDLLARVGGEEFLIAMPETTQANAIACAQNLCERMRRSPVHLNGLNLRIPVTLSIGVALGGNHNFDRSIDSIMQVADSALYTAKFNGRDCAVMG